MSTPNVNSVIKAWNSNVVEDPKEAAEVLSQIKSTDGATQQKGFAPIIAKANDIRNTIYGKPAAMEVAMKHDQLFNPTSTRAYTYNALTNALNLDMNWMQFFQMIPAFGSDEIDLETLTNILEFSEYLPSEETKPKPLGALSYEKLREKRYSVAVDFLNRWMDKNGVLTLQNIVQRIMVANEKKRASVAYTALADTSGVTVEAFATNIETTVNNGINNMIEAMLAANTAFDVTDNSTIYLLSHSKNKVAINARLNATRGTDGTNVIAEYNVEPVYTRNTNVLADLGLGGSNRAMLILPGVANVFGDYKGMTMEQTKRPSVDGVTLYAHAYYNLQAKAIQKRVVTLS